MTNAQNKISPNLKPFRVNISAQEIEGLKQRLTNTRWPDEVQGADWNYGTSLPYMQELVRYWTHDFDWKAQEKKINQWNQYLTEVDGIKIHLIYEKGKGRQNTPIVLLHGWPSSFLQMSKIIPLLTEADADGHAFDVIVPSLPGYGFSGKPVQKGMNVYRISEILHQLMVDQLGYKKFMVRGSDLGAGVAKEWAIAHPEQVMALHLSGSNPYVYQIPGDLSEAEKKYVEKGQQFMFMEGAYAMEQSSKPQTLAFALEDSPVGLAAWIVEKYKTWSDNGGNIESKFSKDDLLTNVSVYWFTRTIGSSMRLYYESAHQESPNGYRKVEVPCAFMMLEGDISVAPKEWEARTYQVVRWNTHKTGGHFGEWEESRVIANDIRAFRKQLP